MWEGLWVVLGGGTGAPWGRRGADVDWGVGGEGEPRLRGGRRCSPACGGGFFWGGSLLTGDSQSSWRFFKTCLVHFSGKPDEVYERHGSATYESIEKAISPINGQEVSYWLNCDYQANDLRENINDPGSAMEIESNMVPLYLKLKSMSHENIIQIHEIYISNDTPMILFKRIDFRLDSYLENFCEDLLSNGGLVTVRLWNVIRDLVDVLEFLHGQGGLAHGNLRLSTTYCVEYVNGEYTVSLAGFGYDSNAQNLEEAKKADWADLGKLLHDALEVLYKEETTLNEQYELLDLCKTLQHLEFKERNPKDLIMKHPAMFTNRQKRVQYIICAAHFVESFKLERRIIDDDVLSRKPWTENIGSKEDSEKLVKYIEQEMMKVVSHGSINKCRFDPSSGWDFIKFVSFFLWYQIKRYTDKDIQDIVGRNADTTESYFRRYQPKLLTALKRVAEQGGFKYFSYCTDCVHLIY